MWAETVCPVSAISNFSVIFILFFLSSFYTFVPLSLLNVETGSI